MDSFPNFSFVISLFKKPGHLSCIVSQRMDILIASSCCLSHDSLINLDVIQFLVFGKHFTGYPV